MRKLLNRWEALTLTRFGNEKGIRKALEETFFDKKEAADDLKKAYEPLMYSLMIDQGREAMAMVDPSAKFEVTDKVREYVTGRANLFAPEFVDNITNTLADTIVEGLMDGKTPHELSKLVQDKFSSFDKVNATRTARTESSVTSNQANLEAYRQSRVVNAKEWYANPGACEFCEEMDGKIVGLDEDYVGKGGVIAGQSGGQMVNSFDTIEAPPLHPNCECTLLPTYVEITEEEQADKAIDFSNPKEVEGAFDLSPYDGVSTKKRNDLVAKYVDTASPVIKGFTEPFDWTLQFQTFDRIKADIDVVDDALVAKYVEEFKKGDKFPPVVAINFSGSDNFNTLIDGRHRIAAMKKLGAKGVPLLVGDPKGYFPLSEL